MTLIVEAGQLCADRCVTALVEMGALPEPKHLDWISYIRYVILRIILWFTRDSRTSRFAAWVDFLSDDPFVYGAIPHPREFEEEWPYSEERLRVGKIDDRLTVFCTSSTGQILTVKFTRKPNKIASAFVYLRTKKASYASVREVRTDLSVEDTFAVDGLKLECVIPMRRWRISFNGLLRNQTTGKDEHVRFVFTANFTNNLADRSAFQSERLLALTLCKSPSIEMISTIFNPGSINEHLKEIDSVVQTYSFVGKVRTTENIPGAESHEEEVYAFGQKTRSHAKDSSPVESRGCFMGYTRNGISCYFEDLSIANFAPSLISGVMLYPSFVHTTIDAIQENIMTDNNIKDYFELQSAKLPVMKVEIQDEIDTCNFTDELNSEYRIRQIRVFKMSFDDKEGFAVFIGPLGPRATPELPKVAKHLVNTLPTSTSNVVSFEDESCSNGSLTGGKASSLAILTTLAAESNKFKVARGVAVTTEAYSKFTEQPAVSEAIGTLCTSVANQVPADELQRICGDTVVTLGKQPLPQQIKDELGQQLRRVFQVIDETKFAVRSSACGEDSEEMSAAGQMETLLGVKGLENIFEAVVKCWASQFSFVAVQYRRRYGQPIDCPMAVCVQEMVDSEVSGVMFTVDPVTANPAYITITANYGLGESVVAATADPDTFVLEKTPSGGRVISSTIGSKKLRTVMLDEGGTRDITDVQDGSSEPCLTESRLSQLAEAALAIEEHYASQRDTEWAFAPGGQLFMLQARPVTSAHVLDSEFESYHESDDGMVCEYDCLSKANVGEVFGGSPSPLTLDTTFRSFFRMFKALAVKMNGMKPADAHFSRDQFFFRQNAQCFFGTYTIMTDYTRDDVISKGFSISMCGRIIDDEIVKVGANNKKRYVLRPLRPNLLHLIRDIWRADKTLDDAENFVRNKEYSLDDCKTSKEMLLRILSATDLQERAIDGHSKQMFYGTVNNVLALTLLSHTEGGYTARVYSDFAKMVSSCNNLVSADVPLSLQKLSHQALEDYGLSFKELPAEEALDKLQNDSTATASMFAKFLKDHGHRCLNEFDLVTHTWSMDPIPVVKTIQSMIGATQLTDRKEITMGELINSLDIKMNLLKRLALRFLVRRVRKGTANRERAKSNLILASHKYRLLFRQLANQMVREGILPDPDLLFFLVPSEIYQLMQTRSPKIIIRAMNRMRIREKAAKDIYPEHVSGLPIRPINYAPVSHEAKGSRKISGTPVSQGSVVATARVVMSIEDAHQIQKGDVLITYATDIGWSPYFPLLGGIVTELGGLISHGAVVAREYGLPCIVAAHGATQLFRSGEKVLLDGSKGILQTVE